MTQSKKNLIWDWNGTLINDLEFSVSVLNQMIKKRNLKPITVDYYLEHFTFPVKSFYEQMGFVFRATGICRGEAPPGFKGRSPLEDFTDISHEFIHAYNSGVMNCSLHKNTAKILDQYQKKGYFQIVMSAMQELNLQKLVKAFKIDHYFHGIYGTDNFFGHGKIEEAKNVVKKLNLDLANTYFIGDTLHDIEVAHAIGARPVIITSGHHPKYRFKDTNAMVLDSISDLIKYNI